MNKMVALWAHPRSRSTVLERVFIERSDFEVFHEPFAHIAFNSDSEIPYDDLNCGLPTTYDGVKDLLRSARIQKNVFHKDMCYHCIDDLKADPTFLLEQENIFLIREPASTVISHHAIYPDMPIEAIGHKALYEIFCYLTKLTGKIPYLINADKLAVDPVGTVKALCEYLELPFLPDSLRWEAKCPPQWKAWRSWHKEAESSTEIVSQNISSPDMGMIEENPRLHNYYEYHRPFYERMNQFAK